MIVYHGGVSEIRHPNLAYAKTRLDFGKAFYLTTFRAQAEKWARRKASRMRKSPVVNKYELSEDFAEFKVKDFGTTKSAIDTYRQGLETAIIRELSRMKKMSLRAATDIYYSSRLCGQISQGLFGIDNLDYKYLAEDLVENEPELFQ